MDSLPGSPSPSPPPPPPQPQNPAADCSSPTVEIPPSKPINGEMSIEKKRKKKTINNTKKKLSTEDASSSSSSSSSFCSHSSQNPTRRVPRVACKRRNPTLRLGTVRRSAVEQEIGALALPVGMSIAAFLNLVLERKDTIGQSVPVDDLQTICSSAVRESLANVYGDKFDCFSRNFERSFGSTLRTLRLINEESHSIDHNVRVFASDSCIRDSHPEIEPPISGTLNLTSASEEIQANMINNSLSREFGFHEEINQLACVPRNPSFSAINAMTPMEKSLVEQTRANDLKSLELGLTMRKMRLKETELVLNYEANHLERSKLDVGIAKASFKAEKFKSQVEETGQAELLKRCIDCLVTGLFIMLASLLYGAYVFSYRKIAEAASACTPSPQESRSWWLPKRISSMNSGLNTLKCQIQVITQMLFGVLIILSIAYSLILRSSASRDTLPITFILLLLGILCGIAGKFCVDTLGGSGYHWLVLWETLCLIHFFSNVFTSVFFVVLHGPITVSRERKKGLVFPYWVRRVLFYGVVVLFLPVFCGLVPFASLSEWKDHFFRVAGPLANQES